MTVLLIGANIAAAFALVFDPELLPRFGFDPNRPSAVSAVASLFLHANTLHLLGNMVFLAAVGPSMESHGRAWQLGVTYLTGGFGGLAAHWTMVSSEPGGPLVVGASGALAACVALYSVRYMRMPVSVAPGWNVPIVYVTGLWVSLQILGSFVSIGAPNGETAYWAHIGGFAIGLCLSLVFRAPHQESATAGLKVVQRMRDRSPAAALAAAENYLSAHPGDPSAIRELADAYRRLGDIDQEFQTLGELMDVLPETDQADVLIRIGECGKLDRIPSLRRTLLAERFKGQRVEVSVLLLESVVSGPDHDDQRPDAMLALAGIRRDTEPEPARRLIDELVRQYPLHPASELARSRGWS